MKEIIQGDVIVREIKEFPSELKETNNVLALGEKTGHKHVLQKAVQVMGDREGNKFFEAGTGTVLVHEEHKAIEIPKGKYQSIIQREYSPTVNRRVID